MAEKVTKITHKKGLQSNLPSNLLEAELAFTTDEKRIYIGSNEGNIEIAKQGKIDEHAEEFLPHDSELNQYMSAPDADGIYTVVEFKKVDGTLYMKSTASNPNIDGNYETFTWEFYENEAVVLTKVWTITYDNNNVALTKEVV